MCSIGLAPNKLLAKIASDLDKPDGFCVLTPEGMLEAVGDRPASLIPGVGPKTFERLRRVGIKTVADLAGAPDEVLGRARLGRGAARPRARDRQPAGARPSASASRRAARRPSPRTSPTARCWSATLDRLAARRVRGPAAQRLPRPHGDAQDPAAPVPHVHALAHAGRRRPRTCDVCARSRASCSAGSRSTRPVRLLGVGLSGLERVADR